MGACGVDDYLFFARVINGQPSGTFSTECKTCFNACKNTDNCLSECFKSNLGQTEQRDIQRRVDLAKQISAHSATRSESTSASACSNLPLPANGKKGANWSDPLPSGQSNLIECDQGYTPTNDGKLTCQEGRLSPPVECKR